MSAIQMSALVLNVSQIPPEGETLEARLDAASLHLEAEPDFTLESGSIEGRVERGEDEAVHFRGRLEARLHLQCGRCAEPFALAVQEDLDLFFLPHQKGAEGQEEDQDVQLSDRDMLVAYYEDDRIDLGDRLREQLHLALPLRQLCRVDCQGLCPSCGINRNTGGCSCRPREEIDERMAPLRKLLEKKGS